MKCLNQEYDYFNENSNFKTFILLHNEHIDRSICIKMLLIFASADEHTDRSIL